MINRARLIAFAAAQIAGAVVLQAASDAVKTADAPGRRAPRRSEKVSVADGAPPNQPPQHSGERERARRMRQMAKKANKA